MTEWPKVHDWKSCVSQGTAGSNPALSAIVSKNLRAAVDAMQFMAASDGKLMNSARPGMEQR